MTVAESWLVASGVSAAGVALKTTEIEDAVVIVAVTFAATGVALSVAVAVALMVTGFTPLAVEGAVYVATAPVAVWVGVILPQTPMVLAHAIAQSTPAFVVSLATFAMRPAVALAPSWIADGTMLTATGSGAGSMVTVAETDTDDLASEVAVIVTVPPDGTEAGAV